MISSTTRPVVLLAATVCALALVANPALAMTWHVPSQCPTIQAGLDSAAAGDTVEVACGTYYEHDVTLKSMVVLVSETRDPECVTIDAQWAGGRVLVGDGLDASTSVRGFTVTGGSDYSGSGVYLTDSGACTFFDCTFARNREGGFHCSDSSPTIVDCCFSENWAGRYGGAFYCTGGSPTVIGCTFSGNCAGGYNMAAWGAGGAICAQSPGLRVEDCVFTSNHAVNGGYEISIGGAIAAIGPMTVFHCDFAGNTAWEGGAVYVTDVSFEMCTFVGNRGGAGGANDTSIDGGGGLSFVQCLFRDNSGSILLRGANVMSNCTIVGTAHGYSHPGAVECEGILTADRSIIAFNSGEAVHEGTAVLSCCDVFGNSGGDWVASIAGQAGMNGNFTDWPRFCDPGNDLFALAADSPCLPENHPHGYDCGGFIGALGQGCGPVALTPQSWARVKARYR